MTPRSTAIAACTAAILMSMPFASADAPKAPQPSTEQKRLGFFVGDWKTEGEWMATEMGPGGKSSSRDKCEWFEGGYSVICRTEGTTPWGKSKSVLLLAYSAEEKVYTYYGLDNSPMAMTTVPRGTVEGGLWTYTDESMMGGRKTKTRSLIKELSPKSYSFSMEVQTPDGKWMKVLQSTSTKE